MSSQKTSQCILMLYRDLRLGGEEKQLNVGVVFGKSFYDDREAAVKPIFCQVHISLAKASATTERFREGSGAVVKHGIIAACLATPLLSSEKTVLHPDLTKLGVHEPYSGAEEVPTLKGHIQVVTNVHDGLDPNEIFAFHRAQYLVKFALDVGILGILAYGRFNFVKKQNKCNYSELAYGIGEAWLHITWNALKAHFPPQAGIASGLVYTTGAKRDRFCDRL
ncbi:hypothetical protein P691DRAFT_787303 [Macrolepiota fuliginosa MF-IS2]|uniref:Uncharacterized protein n=1 Tax=Macrolepiota fuliginosa MF-IS2 TaxID=1400762 RepID=A0A9P5X715_9AGAR|nr:hypothetical protein P691DRAFT_787303 [Macrolepiota fuliginosa MF-IS2]